MSRRKKRKKQKLRAAAAKATDSAKAKAKTATPADPQSSSAEALGHDAGPSSDPKRAPRLTDPGDRYFFSPVASARPYLLLRATLVLLAFDCWIDLIPHAGRYGVGGFNVAHFAILDWLPTPTPAVYIATLLLTGWLAMVMAVRPAKVGLGLLFGLYTYGWSMSMLDSYQHHYLLSLLLFSFIFFPTPSAVQIFGGTGEDQDADLGRWRVIGGAILLILLAEATLASAGIDTPLTTMGPSQTVLIGARATLLLLGVLLIVMVDEAPITKGRAGSAWGYVSFCVTCAIVYFYTAVTKLEPDWRSGDALRRLGNTDEFRELEATATGGGLPLFGRMESDDFWALMAGGAIAVQLVSGLGYLLAAKQESFRGWRRFLIAGLGLAPLSFHIGAERMALEIGWFSYYMLLVLFVVFLPIEVVRPMGAAFSWPARFFLARLGGKTATARIAWAFLAVGTAAGSGLALTLDLPGSDAAGFVLGGLLVGGGLWSMRRGRYAESRGWGLGAVMASLLMWMAVTETDVRYDYYRFVGGDHRRRGEFREALAAYVKANEYVVHPWCLMETQRLGDCFPDEDAAGDRALALGRGWDIGRAASGSWCAIQGGERGRCFRDEDRGMDELDELGAGWVLVTNDRKEKEAEMRRRVAHQDLDEAVIGDD